MAFYSVCPKCGANLDPNERCDCEETARKEKEAMERFLVQEKGTGQIAFRWPPERMGLCGREQI